MGCLGQRVMADPGCWVLMGVLASVAAGAAVGRLGAVGQAGRVLAANRDLLLVRVAVN